MPDYDLLWDSGLALLLILCAVVWGIVLLDTAGRRCGRAYSRVSKAEQRLDPPEGMADTRAMQ